MIKTEVKFAYGQIFFRVVGCYWHYIESLVCPYCDEEVPTDGQDYYSRIIGSGMYLVHNKCWVLDPGPKLNQGG